MSERRVVSSLMATAEDILMSTHMRATEPAGPVEMCPRSFQPFAARAEELLAAVTPDASPIGIDGVPFGLLIDPRLPPAVGFADVGPNLERLSEPPSASTDVADARRCPSAKSA
jgi:hypothetical protein